MAELRKISASEVRLHTSKKDCWLVIHGKVYDVSKFVEDHPGGEEVLVHASGTGDATQSFEDVGHSATARKRMTNYLIGELEGHDPTKAPEARKSSVANGEEGAVKAKAVHRKPTHGLSDYLMPLVLVAVAIASFVVFKDKDTA